MFIVLPSGRPNAGSTSAGIRRPRATAENYGNWSFLKDGATPGNGVVENWFELLESWFNESDSGGPKAEDSRAETYCQPA